MKNIEDIENIGKTPSSVIRVGHGSFRVTVRAGDGATLVETWDIEEPEQLLLTAAGVLIYVDNRGEIAEVIGPSALLRLERGS